MKVAVVFDNMIYGGIERVGISHIKLLKELGHDVTSYVLTPKTEPIVDELREICGVRIVNLPRKFCPEAYCVITRRYRGGKYLFPFIYIVLTLFIAIYKRFIKDGFKYDVAIAFSGHYNDLTFVANNFVRADKKAAWLHGALYQYVLTAQGFENLYKKIKNLVVLVDDAQEEVLAYHKKDNFNFLITKIYNPVSYEGVKLDQEKIDYLKSKYGEYFVMVSRLLYPHKDHYTVIKAVKILREQYGVNRKLVLVGDGPERGKLEKFVKAEDMDDSVIFEGNQNDVHNYYASAYMLLHASVAGEGLPTVLLEAMNLGCPVVCTDSKVGPKEILGNNQYGLLCNVQDPGDMARCIYSLINDREKYNYYKEKGKERTEIFSPNEIKKCLSTFLNKIEK